MPDTPLPEDVHALAARLAEPKPMCQGSVTERYGKCNRSGSQCGESRGRSLRPVLQRLARGEGKRQSR